MNYMLSLATYISLPQSAGTLWPLAPPLPLQGISSPTIPEVPTRHFGSHDFREAREHCIINTHDAYFLWCMSHGHVIDLAYFIALASQHQTERHRKVVISIGPYVTRLARHFELFSTAAQESSLTLIGQMSPQGISSILSMRMIERRRGTYPPQYHLTQSTEEEAYKDIPDDVLSQHENPPTQPTPLSRPVHAAASYADISECLTRFEQQEAREHCIINTHDAYFLWCMSHGHVIDLAYFIALASQHQTERHRKVVISIGPYVTRLARHFELFSTAAQESSLTLIGQMSPQGISSILSMRMIERRRGTYPPQYHLTQSTEEEAYKDIPDDVLSQHENPPTQPTPLSRPVHAAASYADISECLTRFEQQCFQ
ncbi:hypothetical protein GOBAR_AA36152 [Gossypium barbadense]|uniref:Uncharacterized protein n=1 Tax=Gossypium barbadense TaxID=3634 RepID=A0A2P5W0F2_GOSBA|nr:hypothetical protein GOBAR_AA36152 [Gossypium barbadense]